MKVETEEDRKRKYKKLQEEQNFHDAIGNAEM